MCQYVRGGGESTGWLAESGKEQLPSWLRGTVVRTSQTLFASAAVHGTSAAAKNIVGGGGTACLRGGIQRRMLEAGAATYTRQRRTTRLTKAGHALHQYVSSMHTRSSSSVRSTQNPGRDLPAQRKSASGHRPPFVAATASRHASACFALSRA